jgi:hypothetical protein
MNDGCSNGCSMTSCVSIYKLVLQYLLVSFYRAVATGGLQLLKGSGNEIDSSADCQSAEAFKF